MSWRGTTKTVGWVER